MQPKEAPKIRIPRDRLKGYHARPVVHSNNRNLVHSVKNTNRGQVISTPAIPQINVSNTLPIYNKNSTVELDDKTISSSAKNVINTPESRLNNKFKSLINKKVVYACAILVCLTAVFANIAYFLNNNQMPQQLGASNVSQQNDNSSQNQNGPDVSEEPIDQNTINSYIVSPDLPKRISIQSIGIKARVLRMGTDANNKIQSPRSSYDTGWYEGSNKPDENGAVFINGHVSGPTKAGIFYNLKKLNNGDIINIEKGDGTVISYKVVNKETVDVNNVDMQKALRSADVDKQGLNLMTCSGDYSAKDKTFNERLIVYSVRI